MSNNKPKNETPMDETPKDETPKDETPKDETLKDETPKDETPKDETPVKKKTGKKKVEPKFNIVPDESKFSEKDRNLDITKLFVEKSFVKNDELVKYQLFKNKIKEYQCEVERCPTKNGLWRRQPCYLELVRKNCKPLDLRIGNLVLMCPNCYCQEKGPDNFKNVKKKIEHKCVSCGYVLRNKNKSGLCYVCTQKINKGIMDSSFTTYEEMAQLTVLTSENNNYKSIQSGYSKEIEAHVYEDYLKQANDVDLSKNNIFSGNSSSKKSISSSTNIKKNKHNSKNKAHGLDNQTQYSLEIDDNLLSELGDI